MELTVRMVPVVVDVIQMVTHLAVVTVVILAVQVIVEAAPAWSAFISMVDQAVIGVRSRVTVNRTGVGVRLAGV